MNKSVSFNLQIFPVENSLINVVSSAALYGKGVFTTIAIYNGKAFLWEKHWRRLKDNSAKIGVDLHEFDEQTIKAALSRLIFQNNLQNGRARLTFFDERTSRIWNSALPGKTSILITTAEFQPVKEFFHLTVSPFSVNSKSPLSNLKSCNYLESLLTLEEAKKRGFDEAIRLNEKSEIASVSMANIFWVANEKVFTSPIETGCLAGTTRAFLLENFAIEEKPASLEELFEAEEVFLTSSGIGIKSVEKIDEKSFENKFTESLQKFYFEQIAKI